MSIDASPEVGADRGTSVLPALSGQAALFADPRRLLALEEPELRTVAAQAVHEGKPIFAGLRRVFGLVAWAMWHKLPELAYADFEGSYAAELGIQPTTLRRWRRDVVDSDDLPVPAVAALRSEAARNPSRARPTAPRTAVGTGTTSPSPTPDLGAPPPARPKPVPPTIQAAIAHLVDHLLALDPADVGVVMTRSQLDTLMDWTERAVKAAPTKTRKSRGSAPSATTGVCPPHPPARVSKGFCFECGRNV